MNGFKDGSKRRYEMADQNKNKSTEQSGTLQRFVSECSIRAVEGEGNERQFDLSFSSEEPYDRWWGTEILSHAEGCVNLDRLNSIGILLFNHDRNKIMGKVLSAEIKDNRGVARVEFDTDAEAETIYQKVKTGTLKGVSVGYMVKVWEEVAANKKSSDGRFTGPCDIATRWTPYEISVVSIPADPTVGVGRSHKDKLNETDNAGNGTTGRNGSKDMSNKTDNKKGLSGFYFFEKQLQINKNILRKEKNK